ncbi:hypothetical protein L1987_59642 [Smallanthus sonchifolius]|uniref:Uncharacterized protein n=1 Tax=Smallanthus sonchifolius TaxID=185202 RepID=A0ACB9D6D4_9ASTR|nr:hypothetical protein L1987_59642 [Smallanthus sonchifolius]
MDRLYQRVFDETDGSNAYSIFCDTENSSDYSGSVSEILIRTKIHPSVVKLKLNTSFENTKDNVYDGSVENCGEGILKEKVEDICIDFEKSDVLIVDGSDHNSVIEKGRLLWDSEEKLMVVYEEIDHHEGLNVSVKTLNTCTPWFNILTILLLFYFQVLKHEESNGSNADSISCDTDNPSDSLGSVLEMKNEVLECNGSTK